MNGSESPIPDGLSPRGGKDGKVPAATRLTVFLGTCPGAGKTRAMLEAAREALSRGVDLVAGLVETHGDPELEAMLDGLEAVAPRPAPKGGRVRAELDLDALIERAPAIALIDDLAQANRPLSRHAKRWQDVIELLDRGISVWTAVDIRSLESLAEVAEGLTGVPSGERVPDTLIDRADEIRLVDAAPAELIARFAAGKVFWGDRPRADAELLYRARPLETLRELALRLSARAKDGGPLAEGRDRRPSLGELILVAVGPSPSSAYLVRWARRSAYALRADWIALNVEDGSVRSAEERARIEANLALARKLGAETLVAQGADIAEAIVETARKRGASMIVLGRSGLSRLGPLPRRATVTDRIVREAGSIDVAVVQDAQAPRKDLTFATARRFFAAPPRQYALLASAFAAVTGLGFLLAPIIGFRSIAMLYLAAVVGLSFLTRPGPVAATAALSALALNFFFIPPRYTFGIGSPDDWILFAAYFIVASATGSLVSRLRSNQALLAERESRAAFLFGAAQRLAECRSCEDAVASAAALAEEHFGMAAAVFRRELAGGEGKLGRRAIGAAAREIDDGEFEAASYSAASRAICGSRTETMPLSRLRYVPAAARDEAVGAIGIMIPADRGWTRSDDNLLLSLGRTLAVAVERFISEARSRRAVLELESDRLGGILLDTVSHELRTPLTTITGSISALRDDVLAEDPASRRELIDGALEASERLNGIVENLLSLSRIESGMLRLTRRPTDLEEIARAAIDGIESPQSGPFPRRDAARSREIRVSIPHEARSASLDTALVGRLVANLLRNAASYSPEGSPIDLSFEESGADLAIRVRDRGRGVPEGELEAIFEKFRRGSATPASTGGLGLGLAICRGISKAHGGYITARNAPGGGLEVTAAFPSCVAGKDA